MVFEYFEVADTVAEYMGAPASLLTQDMHYVVMAYPDGAMAGCLAYETTKVGLRVRWFHINPVAKAGPSVSSAIIRNFLRSRLTGTRMWVGMMIDNDDINDSMWNVCMDCREKEGAKFRIWPNGTQQEFRLCQPIFRDVNELGPLE